MSVVTPMNKSSYVGSGQPLSDFNSDSSDEYREKFENLKVLVKEQQKQLNSQRVQSEALRTIQACLDEEHRENKELCEKNKKLELIVILFGKRLHENGLSAETDFDATDPQVPSRQFHEDLMEENDKLKKKLQYLQVDPTKMEQVYKEKLACEHELQASRCTIKSLAADNEQLRATLTGSTDDKDAKIVELQQEVDRLRQSQGTQDVICQSLSDETITLKERLRRTAEVCQHLVCQLEQMSAEKLQNTDNLGLSLEKMTMSTTNENFVAENEKLQLDNLQKEEEIEKLKDLNMKWQLYCDEQNNKLALKQCELEKANRLTAELRQEVSDQQLRQAEQQQRVNVAEMARQKAESVNRQQHSEMERLRQQQREQNDIISSLKQQVQALADANGSQAVPCHHDTQIIHLEAQLNVYKEDFECERRDRETAQTKISELENELSLVKRQLDQFQGEYMQRLHQQRQTAFTNFHDEHPVAGCHHPMVARGLYQCDAPGDIDEDGEDEIDGPVTDVAPPEELLQCPSCKKEFPISRHNDLLEHIDECCD